MRQEMQDLKKLVYDLMQSDASHVSPELAQRVFNQPPPSLKGLPVGREEAQPDAEDAFETEWSPARWQGGSSLQPAAAASHDDVEEAQEVEEVLSLQDSERELIRRALAKHRNRRKYAALELGISERTLYRKIKEYGLK
jgi:transcriptional regulator with GAF, ATPase, and Fis domain